MACKIEFHPKVERDLDRIPKESAKEILIRIRENLTEKPKAVGEALKGRLKGFYKFSIGDFRVVYTVESNTVYVLAIAQRGRVYEIAKQRHK
jgi:mRNA interferase RelE/StbE